MKKTIFTTVIATVIAITLAACSASGAKQIVLRPATGETDTFTVGQRANIVGELDLTDATIDSFDIVVEELVPGGSWTQFRKITASKGSSSIGFALVKQETGDFKYRAIVSGKEYGPFTSAEITVKYKAKN
ncbi:MAG: hypothetical protein ACOYKO_02040 [Rhodoluna sp.]